MEGKLGTVWYPITEFKWEEAKKFYSETLGFTQKYADENLGWIAYEAGIPGLEFGISRVEKKIVGDAGVVVLEVEDALKVAEELKSKGVECKKPQDIPGMVRLIRFFDPDGNLLQLAQSLSPQQ
jgi:predicted enzyme related to lactoylglutathione lyase